MSDYIIKYLLTYLFFAALFLPFFYLVDQKHKIPQRKIQKKQTDTKVIKKELFLTTITTLIFMFFVVSSNYMYTQDMGYYYQDVMDNGILYFIFSILVMLALEDAYIYWIHRLLHTKFLFKKVHFLHHKNTNPTIFTAFYLHPVEAFMFPLWILIVPFLLPVHPLALVVVATFTIFYNYYLHLGYEIIPNSKIKKILKKYIFTSTNHNIHHKNCRKSFGYYSNLWDRIMRTEGDEYPEMFDKLTQKDLIEKETKTKIIQKLFRMLQANSFKHSLASFINFVGHPLQGHYKLSHINSQAKILLKHPVDFYISHRKIK